MCHGVTGFADLIEFILFCTKQCPIGSCWAEEMLSLANSIQKVENLGDLHIRC